MSETDPYGPRRFSCWGFSVSVPYEISAEKRMPGDFELYRFRRGSDAILTMFAGDHPNFPHEGSDEAEFKGGRIGGLPAHFKAGKNQSGFYLEALLQLAATPDQDAPNVLHVWYMGLSEEDHLAADAILASLERSEHIVPAPPEP